MASSYLIQGAFKETMQALFVLAFAIGLHELGARTHGGDEPGARWRLLAGVPLAALAIGAVYTYSFPGLTWLAGAVGIWALFEVAVRRSLVPLRVALAPAAVAAGVLVVAVAPELGRMADFASFETFDPDGDGLGNLFNAISPLEALGIWPSGDFRLDPGAGFAPTAVFWLGGLVALAAVGFGLSWWLRRGERAVPAALAAAGVLYLYALVAGTPYQEAKAIAIAAPLAMLVSVRALFEATPPLAELRAAGGRPSAVPALAVVFGLAAAGCSVLALVNGPVGPGRVESGPDRAARKRGPGPRRGGRRRHDCPGPRGAARRGAREGPLPVGVARRPGLRRHAGAEQPPGVENVVRYVGDGRFALDEFGIVRAGAPGEECPFIADGDRADPAASGQ